VAAILHLDFVLLLNFLRLLGQVFIFPVAQLVSYESSSSSLSWFELALSAHFNGFTTTATTRSGRDHKYIMQQGNPIVFLEGAAVLRATTANNCRHVRPQARQWARDVRRRKGYRHSYVVQKRSAVSLCGRLEVERCVGLWNAVGAALPNISSCNRGLGFCIWSI
jgi:hypothetical protein